MATADRSNPNLLERFLGLFTEVKPGEGLIAVLMFANIFLILMSYYILKTVREGLIVGGGGMLGLDGDELKIYASAAMSFLLLGIVPAYGALASRVDRIKLINYCVIAVIACLGIFFVLGRAGAPLGLAFFLWLGIVNVFLIAQFWSYANDIYSKAQGERLFAIIAIGGNLGAIVGPLIVAALKDYTYSLMVGAGVVLALCLLLYNGVNRMQANLPRDESDEDKKDDKPLGKDGGFQLVLREKYLLLIAILLLLSNLVNTTGEFILSNAAKTHAAEVVPGLSPQLAQLPPDNAERAAAEAEIKDKRKAEVSGFYGSFYGTVNLVTFLIQAFLVSRIFKYLGLRVALFFLPIIALGAYSLIGLIGGITLLRIAKTAENSTDYSLQNTVRQALFLPTSREAKYKAKAAIDTFFVRIGDALAAGMVFVGLHYLAFEARTFAFTNVAIIVAWLAVCWGIARQHKRIAGDDDKGAAQKA